jgi:dUTPase
MFKKITKDAILQTLGSKYSACVDVYANEDVVIGSGDTNVVGFGIDTNEERVGGFGSTGER